MELDSIIEFAKGILFLLPEVAILIACIYYLVKNKSIDSILLTIGTFIGFCVMLFWRLVFPLLQRTSSSHDYTMVLVNTLGFIGFVGSVLFAIGLFMLVTKVIKHKSSSV
jgi:hypothetical protein